MPTGRKPKASPRTPKKVKLQPPPGGWQMWKQDAKDGKFLQALVESKVIDGIAASKVQAAYQCFSKYEPNAFRAALWRTRVQQSATYMSDIGGTYKCCCLIITVLDND